MLYIDASKLNFGGLSVSNIGLIQGQTSQINLLNHVNWLSSSSRSSTYAIGGTQIELVDAENRLIRLFSDKYDWDYHNMPENEVINRMGQLPYMLQSKRSVLITIERARSGVDDRHGFGILFYGWGKIKTN